MPGDVRFYAAQDELTDPGRHGALFEELPEGLPGLHAAVNGLLLHAWKARSWYRHLLPQPVRKATTRHTERLLDAVLQLDPAPLAVARPPERRVVVDCRHFAVLLCAVLRHRGVPARPRCGFASYLGGGATLEDHWLCEYWDDACGRWVMEDPDLQRHDVREDEFVTGARGWQLARIDAGFAERCEYDPGIRAVAALRLNLVRDIASVNGFASVSDDAWGLGLTPDDQLTAPERATLDRAADLCAAERTRELRELYAASPGLRVPDVIQHTEDFPHVWTSVAWRDEP
jgi:hypothetical protein